ncbi:hypothetical protein Q3G72_030548 [Acer saccharum]|nr:hypothetical protein Q3G72_030548 [Acer saccharum]
MGVCICYGLAGYLDGTFNYLCHCHHRYFTKSRIYSNEKEQAAKESTDAETVYAEAVYPGSAESTSEATLRLLILAKKLLKAVLEINVAASNSVKEQAAKEAAAAADKEAYEDLNVVQEIDVATSNSGKERQQKRAAEAGYPTSAESTSEATLRMLAKKRLSSKINDDVLDEVYNDLKPPPRAVNKSTASGGGGFSSGARCQGCTCRDNPPLVALDPSANLEKILSTIDYHAKA